MMVQGGRGPGVTWRKTDRNVKRFRGGLVFKAHSVLYHSTLGLRVINKRKRSRERPASGEAATAGVPTFSVFGANPPTLHRNQPRDFSLAREARVSPWDVADLTLTNAGCIAAYSWGLRCCPASDPGAEKSRSDPNSVSPSRGVLGCGDASATSSSSAPPRVGGKSSCSA